MGQLIGALVEFNVSMCQHCLHFGVFKFVCLLICIHLVNSESWSVLAGIAIADVFVCLVSLVKSFSGLCWYWLYWLVLWQMLVELGVVEGWRVWRGECNGGWEGMGTRGGVCL